ncbi:MAG: sigma 54-interacting transcriptional regulator [Myxococcota bacterium]
MSRDETARQLQRVPVIRQLPKGALDLLLSRSVPREFGPGAVLVEEGERGDHVFILTRGRFVVRHKIRGSEECVLARREANDWVGELAIADDRPRSASVVAEGEVRALAISREAFLETILKYPAAALDLLRVVSGRLRESDEARLVALKESNEALATSNRVLSDENRVLRGRWGGSALGDFLGSSRVAVRVRDVAARAATSNLPVLLLGETGTGKELIARGIHRESAQRDRPFVALNCALLSESLLQAELFGSARGAFTGAVEAKPGLVESADEGTLFLDELAEMPLSIQAGLLRFLEAGEYRRLGETRVRRASVRVVAATNADVDGACTSLRKDLLYRLDVFRIELPPLRERPEDLPELLSNFSARVAQRVGGRALRFTAAAIDALALHAFPGNARELQNEVERLYAMLGPGASVGMADLSPRILERPRGASAPGDSYQDRVRSFKLDLVQSALKRAGGNRAAAARDLGLHRANLVRMIRALGIEADRPTNPGSGLV